MIRPAEILSGKNDKLTKGFLPSSLNFLKLGFNSTYIVINKDSIFKAAQADTDVLELNPSKA